MRDKIKKILREENFDWAGDIEWRVPNDYSVQTFNVYLDDDGYGWMEEYEFINAPNDMFDCEDYDECPRSVAEITLYYPESDIDIDEWMNDYTWNVEAYDEDVSGDYVWDKDDQEFKKIDYYG